MKQNRWGRAGGKGGVNQLSGTISEKKKKKKPVVSAECAPGDLVTLLLPSLPLLPLPPALPHQPRLLSAWSPSNPGLEH